MSENIYVGSGKERQFQNGGSVINLTLTLNGLNQLFQQYGFTTDNGRKIIKLNVARRQAVGQYGETHTLTVDTWKPDPQYSQNQAPQHGYQQQQPQQQGGYQQAPPNNGEYQRQGTQPPQQQFNQQPAGQPDRFEDDIPF